MVSDKYRTGIQRFWAAIVDSILFLVLLLVAKWIYQRTHNISLLFALETLVSFAPIVYSILFHYKYGQTIGKWVAKIKVLDVSETRTLTLQQAVYRDSFYLLVTTIGFFYYMFLLKVSDNPIAVLNEYSSFTDSPLFWWTLIELISMLLNAKRRAFHDFIAKTVVVRTEV